MKFRTRVHMDPTHTVLS